MATDIELHPGDKIIFKPQSIHRVRFGGKVRGGALTLTSFSDVQKILDFDAGLFEAKDDFFRAGAAQQVSATVKANADTSGVPEFFFTCGANAVHGDQMVTIALKIAAGASSGTFEVTTKNVPAPHSWQIKTPLGDTKDLARP
jgi:hypothetical protein